MTLTLPEWPIFGLGDDARPALLAARIAGQAAALATIVGLDGGGPRPVGTQMVITATEVFGFLSGGCLEADVVHHAQGLLAGDPPQRLVYGQGSPWPDIQLLCGARIEVQLQRIAPDDPAMGSLLQAWRNRQVATWQGADFAVTYPPTPRLIVLGSDPTALAVAALGAQAGLETTLVRPKGPQTPPPLAGFAYRREEPAEAFSQIGLDSWTAVAVATHDAQTDHVALVAALPSPAFYVGALGARRRLEDRRTWLREAGVSEQNIARLRAPIGLDLGGKAPWEVAVAVIGEIIAARRL